MSLDLSAPVRAAIVAASAITSTLPAYLGSYPVFTRVPVPDDAPYPMVVVAAQFPGGDEDGVSDQRPIIVRDVMVYGTNGRAATSDQYRAVETIAHALRELFHRQRGAITVAGWSVTEIVAATPQPAPVDDEQTVGRRVEVTVRLARTS